MKSLLFSLAVLAFIPFKNFIPGYAVGDKVQSFELKNVDGKKYTLKDVMGTSGVIIVFTCNSCPVAQKYEQRVIELNKKFAPQGFPVVAINPNDPINNSEDSFEAMQVRAKEKSYGFKYLIDEGQKVYPQFGATRTPHVFIVDKTNTVRYIGSIDNDMEGESITEKYAENAIAAIQAGKNPEPNFTRAIGCTIRKKVK